MIAWAMMFLSLSDWTHYREELSIALSEIFARQIFFQCSAYYEYPGDSLASIRIESGSRHNSSIAVEGL